MSELINQLTVIESIRKRPGMYIGSLSMYGVKSMIGSFLDDLLATNNKPITLILEYTKSNAIKIELIEIELTFEQVLFNRRGKEELTKQLLNRF